MPSSDERSSSSESDGDVLPDVNVDSLVTPGELVTEDSVWMRGHGTYSNEAKATFSSVVGTVRRVNKLLSVQTLHGRYIPVVGDHIVGRISEVSNRRWKVDIGASQEAVLQLGSVNLPGGILRRKSEDDELQMREFLKEGDLLNAEVQSIFQDGAAALHTRSLRYGKLRNGMLVKAPASLVLRLRTQVYRLDGGVELILGVNGFIWIRKATSDTSNPMDVSITKLEQESNASEIYKDGNDPISLTTRQTISRYANCIRALVGQGIGISEERIKAAYEVSLNHSDAADLLDPTVKMQLGEAALA